MDNWTDWSLQRSVVLFVGLAFLLVGIQVTMSHYRQNFHHKAMWGPVLSSPLFFLCGVILAMVRVGWLQSLFAILMALGVLSGLVGFYYHFRGVGIRVGGYEARNFLIGPPIIMPLVYTALCVLGLLAVYKG
ncbi:hypothetical protein J31TS4_35690 [Paenibacillus sp. J31TS4]|uniref:hypothetical protein n=1 Tax=Paenibacillus sp. J31TS4 TaxID=2807195 RepID=UPI001B1D8DA1|nr:hypothetical protein [Paenibacillus sp. J31TS4]GIP40289.1 hypothetical protein J31TS4_35690 [Paenibacillus sp. J31TS4]